MLLVSAVVFVDTMFYAVIAPLLPDLADELNLSKVSAGVLTGSYAVGTLLGSIPSGVFAARYGPKQAVLLGLSLLAASTLAFGLLHQIVLLDIVRFIQGAGGACSWAGGLAWLVADAPADKRGAMIGTAIGSAVAGALFGPVVGGLAQATSRGLVFGTVVVFSGVLVAAAIATPAAHVSVRERPADLLAALRRPPIVIGMWLVTVPALASGAINVLGPLRLDHLGASGLAVSATFLVAAGLEAVVNPVVGGISDRRGRMLPVRWGLASSGLVMALVTVPDSALGLAVAIVALAGCLGAFWAPAMAMLSESAEEIGLSQGLVFALGNLSWGLGQVIGSGAGGALAKASTDAVPLGLVGLLCIVTLVVATRGGESEAVAA